MLSSKKLFLAALAVAAVACGDSSEPGVGNPPPGSSNGDAGASGNGADAGPGAADPSDAGAGGDDSGNPNVPDLDGGNPFEPDPSTLDDGGALQGSGSCCAEHDTPGCNNADLMVCVCEKDPTCCSEAWGKQCAFIVEQKYCQPGVRDCVTGSEAGQWERTECLTEWSDFCDSVAELKCGAVPGCF